MNSDILLWNSVTPRMYSFSDGFFDNGIGILQRSLRNRGLSVGIRDEATLDFFEGLLGSEERRISARLNEIIDEGGIYGDEWTQLQDEAEARLGKKISDYLTGLIDYIQANQVKVLGIKTWLGKRFELSEQLAQGIRNRNLETIVVAGGPHINSYKEAALEGNAFDFGVYCEGDIALPEIVRVVVDMSREGSSREEIVARISELGKKGEIPNLIYRENGNVIRSREHLVSLDQKVYPEFDNMPGKINIGVVVDSLGCPWGSREGSGCSFCAIPYTAGKYRVRNPEEIVEEIRHMMEEEDIGIFRFTGSATSAKLAERVAQEILAQDLKLRYSMFGKAYAGTASRFDGLVASYETIIRSGMRGIFIGAEVSDDEALMDVVNKGNTTEDLYHLVKAIKCAAINVGKYVDVGLSFIYPLPVKNFGLDLDQIMRENLDFLDRLDKDGARVDSILVTPAVVLPNTPWYKRAADFGFEIPDDYTQKFLRWNFQLGKPPEYWPQIDARLDGMTFLEQLKVSSRFVKELENRGYAVNLPDEHCLSARACGLNGREGLLRFKHETDRDMMTLDYFRISGYYQLLRQESMRIAQSNKA